MKLNYAAFLFAFVSISLFTACDDKTKNDIISLEAMAGTYADTLGCADCPGTITELTLRPDSTFVMRERALKEGATLVTTTGKISSDEGTLTATAKSGTAFQFEIKENLITLTDRASEPNHTLERISKYMGKKNGQFVYHSIVPNQAGAVLLFTRVDDGDITIDYSFMQNCTEPEKAVLAYFTQRFNSGCEKGSCLIDEAIGMNKSQQKDLILKWMPSVATMFSDTMPRPDDAIKADLSALLLVKKANTWIINYAGEGADKRPTRSMETFIFSEKEVMVGNSETGNVKMRVIEKNENRPDKYPQGGTQVIDMKKVRESREAKK